MKGRLPAARDYALSLALLLFAWWFASGPLQLPVYLLPSPKRTFDALAGLATSGKLFVDLGFTLQNVLLGLAAGFVVGIAVAYALTRLPRLIPWVEGPLVILQTAPKIALAPLFVVWFGLGVVSKVVLIFSLVFFPVFVGAMTGFRSLDPRLDDLARLLRLGTFDRFRQIEIMSAMPDIVVGLRVGAVQALVGAVLSEWMAGQHGLGYLMTYATATYKAPLLFAAVALTVALGIVLNLLVSLVERRVLAWKVTKDG